MSEDPDTPGSLTPRPDNATHPQFAGKSIEAVQRPRYKSWRKKYRKMRARFDLTLEDNKRLFKDEAKLEGVVRRLKEEVDGLLELCLDINNNPAIPPELRFDLSLPHTHRTNSIPASITPEQANDLQAEYTAAVQTGRIPPLDLHVIRAQIEERLAIQDTRPLAALESGTPHPTSTTEVPEEAPLGFMSADEEEAALARLDAKLGEPFPASASGKNAPPPPSPTHVSELTPRELERRVELENPQSQHNWLKVHTKQHPETAGLGDDADSVASHEPSSSKLTGRKRGGKGNLAKTLGDKALGRARDGGGSERFPPASPSATSHFEDDDMEVEGTPGAEVSGSGGKKRGGDPDKTFKAKSAKTGSGSGSGGGGKGGKRKRMATSGGDETPTGGGKKARISEMGD